MSARYAMGTFLQVRAAGAEAAVAREALFARIAAIEDRLSVFREDSDIARVNRAAGLSPVEVSPDAFDAVACALRMAGATDGAFDPTFRSQQPDFRRVLLEGRSIFLPEAGMLLDLGAVGKGWALDRALEEIAPAYDVSRIVADFGGQLQFWSESGRFPPYQIAIENPGGGAPLSALAIETDCSVSTSSQTQNPGHLRDPRTGLAAAGCLSATAVARTGAEAEALSTALFVLGPSAADGLLARFPGAKVLLH